MGPVAEAPGGSAHRLQLVRRYLRTPWPFVTSLIIGSCVSFPSNGAYLARRRLDYGARSTGFRLAWGVVTLLYWPIGHCNVVIRLLLR